jgi:hypothetical protein
VTEGPTGWPAAIPTRARRTAPRMVASRDMLLNGWRGRTRSLLVSYSRCLLQCPGKKAREPPELGRKWFMYREEQTRRSGTNGAGRALECACLETAATRVLGRLEPQESLRSQEGDWKATLSPRELLCR